MKNNFSQDTRIFKAPTKSLSLLAITLILSGLLIKTQAKSMEEAVCKPRPVTVAVTEDHSVAPYHVILHRCSGTCDNTSPHIKLCNPKDTVEIDVDVTGVNNKQKIVKVTNHTSCLCGCRCKDNEILEQSESCKCKCIENCDPDIGPEASGARKGDDEALPTPYLIGMAFVGIFAIFVLLFDATLLVKRKGFIHAVIKHTCCGSKQAKNRESSDNQEMNGHSNGCQHTVV